VAAVASPTDPDGALPAGLSPGRLLGWHLHTRRDQRQPYRACYALVMVSALKLLWRGLRGYGLV
jgi:hypothetical protein